MQSISILCDQEEYSRYVPGLDKVTAYLTLTGANAGDNISVSLNRSDEYGQITSSVQTFTATAGQGSAQLTFDLNAQSDTWNINRVVQGLYTVQATDGITTWTSPQFYVSIIPVSEMRNRWAFGVPLHASNILGVLMQPLVLTGVTISSIPDYVKRGVHNIALKNSSTGLTLSFDNGTAVPVNMNTINRLVLVDAVGAAYIQVSVNPSLLPSVNSGSTVTDTIVVDSQPITDDTIRQYITQAYGDIESAMFFPIEPRYVDTDNYNVWSNKSDLIDNHGTTINYNFTSADPKLSVVERSKITKSYYRPRDFMRWMEVSLPLPRILHLHILAGFFNESMTLNVTPDWYVSNRMSGEVDLVPNSGAIVTWQFFESAMLQFLYIYDDIPGFWHFRATQGLANLNNDTDTAIVRELVAKKAAVDLIGMAGVAYSGGKASISTSRDGVSESITYAGKFPGSDLVAQYQEDISSRNLTKIRNRLTGPILDII